MNDFLAHLVGQVDRLGGVGQVTLIRKDIGRGGDVADDARRTLIGAEILRRDGVECRSELGRGTVDVARGEADPRVHEGEIGMERRGLLEPIHLAQRAGVVPRRHIRVHHRRMRAQRGRLRRHPAPRRRQRLGSRT